MYKNIQIGHIKLSTNNTNFHEFQSYVLFVINEALVQYFSLDKPQSIVTYFVVITAVIKGKFFALHLKNERSSCETAEIRQFCKAFCHFFMTKIAAMLQRVDILL